VKAKVIKRFKDKYTGERYLPGSIFEGETARIKELEERQFVVRIDNAVETAIDYNALTKKELQSMLDKKGIGYNNKLTKEQLINLIGGE
jgi:hypothetical protein